MTDDGFDGGPSAHFALDGFGRAASLLGDEDLELVLGRRVVAVATMLRIALREPRSATMRWSDAPILLSMSGMIVARVWPS